MVSVGFVWYIVTLGGWHWKPDFDFFRRGLFREMLNYALFGIIGGMGYMLISKLDTWLVGTFVGLESNGIYSISMFVSSVMDVPTRALVGISVPLIAKHWHEKNMVEISTLYRQVSINLLVAGLFFFGAFWVSVEPFFQIIVNGEMLSAARHRQIGGHGDGAEQLCAELFQILPLFLFADCVARHFGGVARFLVGA
jgi:O-antigen/teichoic acid export membrane protein